MAQKINNSINKHKKFEYKGCPPPSLDRGGGARVPTNEPSSPTLSKTETRKDSEHFRSPFHYDNVVSSQRETTLRKSKFRTPTRDKY